MSGDKPDAPEGFVPGDPIRVVAGEIPWAVAATEEKLINGTYPCPIFQRAGMLVHIADRPARRSDGSTDRQAAIVAAEPAAVRDAAACVAIYERYDSRTKDWVRIDPPARVIEGLMAAPRWRLPDLYQLAGSPTLRADGSLLSAAGYDAWTGLYLLSELPGLAVPDRPTRRQAEAANETLASLFASFPFIESPEGLALSVAMAGLIAAVLRPTLPAAPLIGVSAPAPGTGKSYLVDVISIIATGRRAVGVATGSRPEEFEKSLGAALLEGRPLLNLDNMVVPLSGQLLCMTLTQDRVAVRLLGHSRSVDTPCTTAIFATGNNLRIQGDMSRRALICAMDARLEHPEDREFDGDLLAEVRARRTELVSAVLTIARWGHQQRDPAPRRGRQFAGFADWCARVRDPLMRLGHPDPVAALDVTRGADIEGERLRALVAEWHRMFADRPQTCAAAINSADEGLAAAMVGVTGDRPGAVSSRRLTTYLARMEARIVGGKRFVNAGKHSKTTCWVLEAINSNREEFE